MTKYTTQERKKYWPVSPELMAQYKDGTNTGKDRYGSYWENKNGHFHRDGDKPAIIYADGSLVWVQNSQLHRSRGPAVIRQDGILEWWFNGKNITDEVNAWLAGEEWYGTPEQIFEFQLRFL